mgnify:FL=1
MLFRSGDKIFDGAVHNKNEFFVDGPIQGINFMPGKVAQDDPAWGSMTLTTDASAGVTYRTSSIRNAWSNAILDFWDDFSEDGRLEEKEVQVDDDPMASLSVQQRIPAFGTAEFQFFLTWHFPNRTAWADTMDVNYSGPNPQMQFWYLGALKAAEKMALAMNDGEFAEKCAAIYKSGSQWTDHLFNGEYYEHRVLDPHTKQEITDVTSPNMPKYQLAKGCLVDQLVGQYMAHICNLGYLAP